MKTPRRRDGGVSLGKTLLILKITPYPPFPKWGRRKPHSRDYGVLKSHNESSDIDTFPVKIMVLLELLWVYSVPFVIPA